MTQAQIDALPILEETLVFGEVSYAIAGTPDDAPMPFVVLVKRGEHRSFSNWAQTLTRARSKVENLVAMSRALHSVPANRRVKAMPR